LRLIDRQLSARHLPGLELSPQCLHLCGSQLVGKLFLPSAGGRGVFLGFARLILGCAQRLLPRRQLLLRLPEPGLDRRQGRLRGLRLALGRAHLASEVLGANIGCCSSWRGRGLLGGRPRLRLLQPRLRRSSLQLRGLQCGLHRLQLGLNVLHFTSKLFDSGRRINVSICRGRLTLGRRPPLRLIDRQLAACHVPGLELTPHCLHLALSVRDLLAQGLSLRGRSGEAAAHVFDLLPRSLSLLAGLRELRFESLCGDQLVCELLLPSASSHGVLLGLARFLLGCVQRLLPRRRLLLRLPEPGLYHRQGRLRRLRLDLGNAHLASEVLHVAASIGCCSSWRGRGLLGGRPRLRLLQPGLRRSSLHLGGLQRGLHRLQLGLGTLHFASKLFDGGRRITASICRGRMTVGRRLALRFLDR